MGNKVEYRKVVESWIFHKQIKWFPTGVDPMFVLTDLQRLVILSGCLGLLVLVVIFTTCFVCPVCWINKKLARRQKRKEQIKMEYIHNNFQVKCIEKDAPPPYNSPIFVEESKPADFKRSSINSTSGVSETDSVAGIPLPSLSETSDVASEVSENTTLDRGNVCITLLYKKITGDNNKVFPQLRVDLKEANDLQQRSYGGRCNPYFKISLYDIKAFNKRKRRKFSPEPLHQFHSTVVRKCQHPVYNDSFFFPMEQINLKKCILKVEARDHDSMVNDTILGEATIQLKEIATCLSQEPCKELDLNLKLEDSKLSNGQLLLGLCYLPTAERMTVAVLKASGLKKIIEAKDGVDIYVQAMAIYAGKVFEKRRTSQRPSLFPVFNEMLMFDVPFKKLDHIAILLGVYRTRDQLCNGVDEGQKRISSKDLCLGKVVIGASSRKNSLNHWNAMRNAPRRQVMQWHELR